MLDVCFLFADYSPCGQAGDVGDIKLQATVNALLFIGRVVGGRVAANRAWPWQVVISHYHGLPVQPSPGWPRSLYVSKIL